MKRATIALAATFLVSGISAGETHPFSIHDMLAMQRVSDAQVSPDGKWVLHGLRTTDLEANRGLSDLWLTATDGSGSRQLTTDPASEYNARWAGDGTVYFLSTRGGSSQVWKIAIDGGEARQATDLPLDVGSLAVSSDGKRLAVSMDVFVDCDTLQCTVDRLAELEEAKTTGRVYDKLFIRHWDTWKDGRRSHVFTMPAGGGDPRDVMAGLDADCPAKPFGGPEDYTFSPDGSLIVFAAREAGETEPWSTNFDLYAVRVSGGKPRNLTADNKAWDAHPVFSPDGKTLAWQAMVRPTFEADRFRIRTMAWPPKGKARTLTEKWDRSPGSISWSRDGSKIWAIAGNLGQRSLFAVDPGNGKVTMVIEEGAVRSIDEAAGRLVYGMDSLTSPVELFSAKTDGSDAKQISHFNDDRVAAANMGSAEYFMFKGWNDEKVQSYVVTPANFDKNKKYPVAFLIHGGPQGAFGNSFHYRWNPQAYTGAGYAAVMINFHGSTGFGQDFTDSISGDWGGKPLEDLQKGLAATLERYPWMDGDRICALGASYGGYMVNWIAGNWPDRFDCLVNHDGILDQRSMYYETEELWFPEWEHGGTPWEVPENYETHNPVNFVKNWKTPMLVVHGALDYRVVEAQGMATFTALQRRGIPSKLLYYPDENHWVLKPQNSVQWHDAVIDWLDEWTGE